MAKTKLSPTSYTVTILSQHDGDTITVCVNLGFGLSYTHPLRLHGVNCPELCTTEGVVAKNYTEQWLKDHPGPYTMTPMGSSGRDKYGRLLGKLQAADGRELNS